MRPNYRSERAPRSANEQDPPYLSEKLPIQYKVKNFTKTNLRTIEDNWEKIKEYLSATVRLISRQAAELPVVDFHRFFCTFLG